MAGSALVVRKIDSLAQIPFVENEVNKIKHYVVKGRVFDIIVQSPIIDLNKACISIIPLYDYTHKNAYDGLKEVKALRVNPLHYNVFASDDGKEATIQITITVLSSQLEKSDLVLKLILYNPADGQTHATLTENIHVTSKKAQIEVLMEKFNRPRIKSKKRKHYSDEDEEDTEEDGDYIDGPPPLNLSKYPRYASEMMEIIRAIQKKQNTELAILSFLAGDRTVTDTPQKKFASTFMQMICSFQNLPRQERALNLISTMLNLDTDSATAFQEFLQILSSAGQQVGTDLKSEIKEEDPLSLGIITDRLFEDNSIIQ